VTVLVDVDDDRDLLSMAGHDLGTFGLGAPQHFAETLLCLLKLPRHRWTYSSRIAV